MVPPSQPLPELEDAAVVLLADVPPTWRAAQRAYQQQHTASKQTATDPVPTVEADVQTTWHADAGVQASPVGTQQAGSGAHEGEEQQQQLAAFLARTEPMMQDALAANDADAAAAAPVPRRRPADGVIPGGGRSGGSCTTPEVLATLTAFASRQAATGTTSSSTRAPGAGGGGVRRNPHRLQVTTLSWNKSGQTLAASFGRYDAEGWNSSSPGAIATWSLARLQDTPGRDGSSSSIRADRVIAADSSLMCCAFHPTEPALLAGGTCAGEVVIWDLSRDDADAQVCVTDMLPELRHREPVTAISWQRSPAEARRHGCSSHAVASVGAPFAHHHHHRLFTLGADGRLLVWAWANGSLGEPIFAYELRVPAARPGCDPRVPLGGSCLAFCPDTAALSAAEEASLLLVGTEGGRLLRCQVGELASEAGLREFAAKAAAAAAAAAAPLGDVQQQQQQQQRLELSSPVQDAQQAVLGGAINSLAPCPHHRRLAVAAGGDGTLRILDVLRSTPLLLLEPSAAGLLAAAWSPSRPCVVAAGGADGVVHLYDLAARQRILQPVAQLLQTAQTEPAAAPPPPTAPAQQPSSTRASVSGINALAFNARCPGLLAAAAGDAVVLWRLPDALVTEEPGSRSGGAGLQGAGGAGARGEAALLRRLVESEDPIGLLRTQCITGGGSAGGGAGVV